jgi:hypothetical protein
MGSMKPPFNSCHEDTPLEILKRVIIFCPKSKNDGKEE